MAFGDSVVFSGPVHGVVSFIVVVVGIIVAEQTFLWIYRSLGDSDVKDMNQTEVLIKVLNEEANADNVFSDTNDLDKTETFVEENKK